MPAYVTFHQGSLPRGATGVEVPLLGRRITNRVTITVGAVASAGPAPCDCIASISTTENCCVEIGAEDAANASNSEFFVAGRSDQRVVKEGEYVSIIAP